MAKKTNLIDPKDSKHWVEVDLPSGVKAKIRKTIMMGDVMEAQERFGEKATSAQMSACLIARLCLIEGEEIVYEDVKYWPPADFTTVMQHIDISGFQ